MKRVLIIAYYWPPSGGAGVQRWLKFVKYLPNAGWEPVLVVPEGASYPVIDLDLLKEVSSDLEVIRCPIVEPAGWLERIKGNAIQVQRLGSGSNGDEKEEKWSGRLIRWIRGNVFIPDSRFLWIRPASRRIKTWLKSNEIDAVVSTGPPHSVHLIAASVKKAHPDIPWMADFRDPWSDMDYLDDFLLTPRSRRRHKYLEQQVIALADRVVITSPSACDSLLGRPLMEKDEQVVWIPNGYDEEDGFGMTQAPAEGPLLIGFFGALYYSRNAPGLWKAVCTWNSDSNRRPIQLLFYGTVDPKIQAELNATLSPRDWMLCGSIPHHEVPSALGSCHGLLLIQNNNNTGKRTIPGKVFEYLAAHRPLVVSGAMPSDLQSLVASWGFEMCGVDDESGFMSQLEGVQQNRLGNVDPTAFRRDRLTQKISEELLALTQN